MLVFVQLPLPAMFFYPLLFLENSFMLQKPDERKLQESRDSPTPSCFCHVPVPSTVLLFRKPSLTCPAPLLPEQLVN